jgi:hypothetical protein
LYSAESGAVSGVGVEQEAVGQQVDVGVEDLSRVRAGFDRDNRPRGSGGPRRERGPAEAHREKRYGGSVALMVVDSRRAD